MGDFAIFTLVARGVAIVAAEAGKAPSVAPISVNSVPSTLEIFTKVESTSVAFAVRTQVVDAFFIFQAQVFSNLPYFHRL